MAEERFTSSYEKNVEQIEEKLRVGASFDLISRELRAACFKARILYVDGLCPAETLEKIISVITSSDREGRAAPANAADLAVDFVTFGETEVAVGIDHTAAAVLSGSVCLVAQGYDEAVLIDARHVPLRGVDEPQNDRVLRGPHDGFVESVVMNASLIRRRIRDPRLTMELHSVGSESRSDVVLCYMEGKVRQKELDRLREKISGIRVKALAMNQQSLLECLSPERNFNPFPKVRYTERPDCATAAVMEGNIIIMMGNTPVTMIVPSGVFDFLQDTNDFYLSPCVGSYIRAVRLAVVILTLFLTPCWYLLVSNPEYIPDWLGFITVEKPNTVPLIAQLFIVEIIIDALKSASINTPSALNNSFSVLGALVLGEFAVEAGWFVPEVVLYMAFVAITDFAQPNVEFGYALKLMRMILLALVWIMGVRGLVLGVTIILLFVATTKTVTGSSYLYPLIPFNWRRLTSLLIRRPLQKK